VFKEEEKIIFKNSNCVLVRGSYGTNLKTEITQLLTTNYKTDIVFILPELNPISQPLDVAKKFLLQASLQHHWA
jgi:hypothetical protein